MDVQFGVMLILCPGSLSYRQMSYQRIALRSFILVGSRLSFVTGRNAAELDCFGYRLLVLVTAIQR